MQERKAVERVIERMRRHHEMTRGFAPDPKSTRRMERAAKAAAEELDNKKRRK